MHHQDRGCEKELDHKISITYSVHTVLRNGIKTQLLGHHLPVKVKSRTGHCSASKGKDVHPFKVFLKPLPVSFQHFVVGQQVVRQEHGLGSLQVCVPRNDQINVFFSKTDQGPLHFSNEVSYPVNGLSYIQANVQGNLVVPASSRGKLFPNRADLFHKGLLHKGMDIFLEFIDREFPSVHFPLDLCEAIKDLGGLLITNNPLLGQHPAVGHAALYILGIEACVKADGGIEPLHHLIHVCLKTTSPNLVNHESSSTLSELKCHECLGLIVYPSLRMSASSLLLSH